MPEPILVSVCIPVFNEEDNVQRAYEQVAGIFERMPGYTLEMIFTDNHSSDRTFDRLTQIAAADPRVRVARFAHNVGYQRSILSGYLLAKGDAVVQLDCDLQDPPELIPQMIERWRDGADVVYGVRRGRREGFLITAVRKIFYRGLDLMSDERLPHDAGDFRLLDRRVVEVLRQMDDKSPYLRGMVAVVGFNQVGLEYKRNARTAGESKFRLRSLMTLAIDGLVSHSTLPLQISSYLGLLFAILAVGVGVAYLIARLAVGGDWPAGFTTLAVLVLANMALTAMLFGIFGLYLARILRQVRDYPVSIVERAINLGKIDSLSRARILDASQIRRKASEPTPESLDGTVLP